jgi:hypothetical protein
VSRERATENWRDLISKPQDRVTLGIVDIYSKDNSDIFEKQSISGSYDSS